MELDPVHHVIFKISYMKAKMGTEIEIIKKYKVPVAIKLYKAFLDLGFYLCLIPYKFVGNPSIGYSPVKYRIQKCFCIFVYIAIWLLQSSGILFAYEQQGQNTKDRVPTIFNLVVALSLISTVCCTAWIMTKHQSTLHWMLSPQFLQTESQFGGGSDQMERHIISYWISRHPVLLMMTFYFFITIAKTVELSTEAFSSHSGFVIIPIIISVILLSNFIHFCNLFFFVLTLFVEHRVNLFVDFVFNCGITEGDMVLEKYFILKRDVQRINSVFNLWVLFLLLTGLPFHCLEMRRLLQMEGEGLLFSKILIGIYILITGIGFIRAAQPNHLIGKVLVWLGSGKNVDKIPPNHLTLLLHELSTESIGLQGGKFFTFSYRFISTATGLIITYSIIVLQMSQVSESN